LFTEGFWWVTKMDSFGVRGVAYFVFLFSGNSINSGMNIKLFWSLKIGRSCRLPLIYDGKNVCWYKTNL